MSKTLALVAVLGGLSATALADPDPAPAPDTSAPDTSAPCPSPATDPCQQGEATEPAPAPTAPVTPVSNEPEYQTQQTTVEQPPYGQTESVSEYAWYDPHLQSGVGVGVYVGGGAFGFTDSIMRDSTHSVGGAWTARLSLGTHIPIGFDVNYVGTAEGIHNNFTNVSGGTLIGTTIEGLVRWNVMSKQPFTPYLYGGAGWQNYSITNNNNTFADTGINSHTNFLEIPAGLGLSFRSDSGFTFDARGTYHWQVTGGDLLVEPVTGNEAKLNWWEASGLLGYEW